MLVAEVAEHISLDEMVSTITSFWQSKGVKVNPSFEDLRLDGEIFIRLNIIESFQYTSTFIACTGEDSTPQRPNQYGVTYLCPHGRLNLYDDMFKDKEELYQFLETVFEGLRRRLRHYSRKAIVQSNMHIVEGMCDPLPIKG